MADADVSRFLLKEARVRARLTQRELAVAARTSQATIAAYETGRKSPRMRTLVRILAAAGFELRTRLELVDPHDLSLEFLEASLPAPERSRFGRAQRRRRG